MSEKAPDHRPRVAAERRERMRQRLVETALLVFAEQGVGASIIADVVAAAGVSQGSFYNYFRSNEELLAAVGDELSGELVQLIEPVVGSIADPALRVATGMRCYLHFARSHRLLARFLAAAGLPLLARHSAALRYLPADVEEGQRRGVFDAAPLPILLDLITGTGLVAIDRIGRGRVPRDYPDNIVAIILRGLGMAPEEAGKLVAAPMPKLKSAPDSLLMRAQARADEAAAG